VQLSVVTSAGALAADGRTEDRLEHDSQLEHQLIHPDAAHPGEGDRVAHITEVDEDLTLQPGDEPDDHLGRQRHTHPGEGRPAPDVGDTPKVLSEVLIEGPGGAAAQPFLDNVLVHAGPAHTEAGKARDEVL